MQQEVLYFYTALRDIFGVCPCCGEIFRVSDAKLYQKKKPEADWKDRIDRELQRLDALEEKIQEKISAGRELAREAGRKSAQKLIKKLDQVFSPLRLNCDDCKVIFHPVDFIVFDGMKAPGGDCLVKEIVLLDKDNKKEESLRVQKSIAEAVRRKRYDWLTLRVEHDGTIAEED
jgi:predicted Holliday junction resolvase-like endonuclease